MKLALTAFDCIYPEANRVPCQALRWSLRVCRVALIWSQRLKSGYPGYLALFILLFFIL